MKPKICILTMLWQRPELTALVLRQWARAREEVRETVDLTLLAIGSEGSRSQKLLSPYPWASYLEQPNLPLARKFNVGVKALRATDCDAMVHLGTDNLLSTHLFPWYADRLNAGDHYFGLEDFYFFDAPSQRLGYWGGYRAAGAKHRASDPVGAGCCHSRAALDAVNWSPLPDESPKSPDFKMARYFSKNGFPPKAYSLASLNAKAVDIKVGLSVTPFQSIPYRKTWKGAEAANWLADLVDADDLAWLTRWRAAA